MKEPYPSTPRFCLPSKILANICHGPNRILRKSLLLKLVAKNKSLNKLYTLP
uniref:Uncharacterized protein n=1 Tax=Rhizophagus irregularis (strain DAOM 181602 / DAOM 197198 / MUCL 43194) TaxID=747089 RepID=U9U343_RHIID